MKIVIKLNDKLYKLVIKIYYNNFNYIARIYKVYTLNYLLKLLIYLIGQAHLFDKNQVNRKKINLLNKKSSK